MKHLNLITLSVISFMPLLSHGQTKEESPRALTKAGKVAEATVAVDGVTAWPNLKMLPNGDCVAFLYNRPSHGREEGDLECWGSIDGAKTWKYRGTPALHEPKTVRMNAAVGFDKNNELLVICSGWSDLPIEGQVRVYDMPFRSGICDPWVCRSSDGGKTWKIDKTAFPLTAPDGGVNIPFGDIVMGADGTLRAAAYSVKNVVGKAGGESLYIYRSSDNGVTWGDPVALDHSATRNETALIHLGGGQWLAASRENGNGLHLYVSNDDGQTWTHRSQVTTEEKQPAHILKLDDGRLVLTYGNRMENKGVEAVISRDNGVTWSKPLRLVDFVGDGGYPSSVQRADGQVLTVFYAQKTDYHDKYHMGAVVWDVPKSE